MTYVHFSWKQLDGLVNPYKATSGVVTITPISYSREDKSLVTDASSAKRVTGEYDFNLPPNSNGTFYQFELNPNGGSTVIEYRLVPDNQSIEYVDLPLVDKNADFVTDPSVPPWIAELEALKAANTLSYIILGPGRPDRPETTDGQIDGSEAVGFEYRSTDGADVGANVWVKRPDGNWEVIDGDTKWRNMGYLIPEWPPEKARLLMRRINSTIYVSLSIAWGEKEPWTSWMTLPVGFRGPDWSQYIPVGAAPDAAYVPIGMVELSQGFQVGLEDTITDAGAYYTYISEDVWLDAPVGVPGTA